MSGRHTVSIDLDNVLPPQTVKELIKLNAKKKAIENMLFRIKCRIGFVKYGLKAKMKISQKIDHVTKAKTRRKRELRKWHNACIVRRISPVPLPEYFQK
jgi:hypothetical protein